MDNDTNKKSNNAEKRASGRRKKDDKNKDTFDRYGKHSSRSIRIKEQKIEKKE